MMVAENPKFTNPYKQSVGGTDYVPPTLCPRAANVPANTAANAGRTGRPESALCGSRRPASHPDQKQPVLEAAHEPQ